MADPTYADAVTAQTQTQIRDALLASLAASGSVVGGLPMSSPDRGLVEADAAQLAAEQAQRAIVAQAATITGAAAISDPWTDADATWYQVSNGAGGTGRIPAQASVWTVGLVVAAAAAPVTIQPGQVLQLQAADPAHNVFAFSGRVAVTLDAGSSYKAAAQFTARRAGLAADSTASAIKLGAIITSSIAGLSIDTSVTPTLVTAARDPETSPALALRCLASWSRLGAGWTGSSFDYLIPILAPGVTRWRIDTSNPYGPGTVGVTIADSTTTATDPEVTAVHDGLNAKGVRPLGSGEAVVAKATTYADTLTIVAVGDGTNPSLQSDIEAALNLLNGIKVIGPWYLQASFVIALASGASYKSNSGGTTKVAVPVSEADPLAFAEVDFYAPGFSGVAALTTVSSTGGFPGGDVGGGDPIPSGAILQVTPAVTVT